MDLTAEAVSRTPQCTSWAAVLLHVIECLFGKLKRYRRIAMRYEKKASYFKGMLWPSRLLCYGYADMST